MGLVIAGEYDKSLPALRAAVVDGDSARLTALLDASLLSAQLLSDVTHDTEGEEFVLESVELTLDRLVRTLPDDQAIQCAYACGIVLRHGRDSAHVGIDILERAVTVARGNVFGCLWIWALVRGMVDSWGVVTTRLQLRLAKRTSCEAECLDLFSARA